MKIWLLKYGKRFLQQKLFWFLLIIMPIGMLVFSHILKQQPAGIQVGIGCEEEEELERDIIEALKSHKGIVRFEEYSTKDSMKQAIQNGDIQCGYFLRKNFSKRLNNEKYKNAILQFRKRGDSTYVVASTVVFAKVFESGNTELVDNFVRESGYFEGSSITRTEIQQLLVSNYNVHDTFKMSFENEDVENAGMETYLMTPLRGGMALLILLAGFCGLVMWKQDKEKGILEVTPYGMHSRLSLISIGIPTFAVTLSAMISQCLGNFEYFRIQEVFYLFLYGIMVTLFVDLFAFVPVSGNKIWGIALMCVFLNAVVTPMFFNISLFLPQVKYIQWLCPTSYFLLGVYGGVMDLVWFLIGIGVLVLANFLLRKKR